MSGLMDYDIQLYDNLDRVHDSQARLKAYADKIVAMKKNDFEGARKY